MERFLLKYSPVIERVSQELDRKIDVAHLFGFHGMSIHTLAHVITHSAIPGRTEPDSDSSSVRCQLGDLFVSRPLEIQHQTVQDAYLHAAGYAETLARSHEFCVQLGLDLTIPTLQIAAYELTDNYIHPSAEPYINLLHEMRISDSQIQHARTLALQQHGIVIGIDLSVESAYEVVDATPDDGWKIVTQGKGMSFTHMYGIYPQGERERIAIATWVQKKE